MAGLDHAGRPAGNGKSRLVTLTSINGRSRQGRLERLQRCRAATAKSPDSPRENPLKNAHGPLHPRRGDASRGGPRCSRRDRYLPALAESPKDQERMDCSIVLLAITQRYRRRGRNDDARHDPQRVSSSGLRVADLCGVSACATGPASWHDSWTHCPSGACW